MAIVYGQIESLKRIKDILNQKGIIRFNSIDEVNAFIRNYEFERQKVFNHIEHDLNREIDDLHAERIKFQKNYDNLKAENINKLNNKINRLISRHDLLKSKKTKYQIGFLFNLLLIMTLKYKKINLEKNFDKIIHKRTHKCEIRVNKIIARINEYTLNKGNVISERCLPQYRELAYINEVVNGLNNLIKGAIGENLVEKELKKLSDKYVLFNDFSIKFPTPIFNKKENDRIFSIQIDHLLITNSGIFILETKNWSKSSMESFNLRSPVEQIMRTSYALFVILNGDSGINLNKHHWGKKQIPIRNIVVMVNEKPKGKI